MRLWFRFMKYSKLWATAVLPGTDKAVGRLVDMNCELKWTSVHNLTWLWTGRGPNPEKFFPNEGMNGFLCTLQLPLQTCGHLLLEWLHKLILSFYSWTNACKIFGSRPKRTVQTLTNIYVGKWPFQIVHSRVIYVYHFLSRTYTWRVSLN